MSRAPRDYKKEYADYQGTPEQIKRRAQRNKARRELGLSKGDPREAAHVGENRRGKLGSRVRVLSRKKNRTDQPKRDGSQD